ncbi:MAG TPA: hypothetical protein VFA59_02775 [Vicinamibacterales bacterium]|nr:hypothetical protein [Vicinamibacterales bacterium]
MTVIIAAVMLFANSPQYPMFPRELEIAFALSAAPAHVRDGATVLALERTGYVIAKHGTNAFTCLVSRRGGDVFPVCWDAEGTRALVAVDIADAQLRLEGKSSAEIDRIISDGYAHGRFFAPARAGISYMLSPMRYRIDANGAVTRTTSNPHLMFYGPNLTDADIGGVRGSFAFINKVGPDGMIIVPVGSKERDTIVGETQPLVEQVERAIGYQSK